MNKLVTTLLLSTAFTVFAANEPFSKPEHFRVILNNDGGDFVGTEIGKGARMEDPVQEFLRRRTTGIERSGVTTISYCTSWALGLVLHKTEVAQQIKSMYGAANVGDIPSNYSSSNDLIERFRTLGVDPLQVMADYCKTHGLELWWSMRMNDTHDDKNETLLSEFKQTHPHLLFGGEGRRTPRYGRWSGADYSHPEVRDFALAMISEVIEKYPINGIELDFFRHPIFFKSVANGKSASAEDLAAMTDFMQKVRQRVDAHNSQLPPEIKKLLLGIRTPDSIEYCREIGLDIESWFQKGLLDFCVFGGYFRLSPWSESAALAAKYGIPSYASIDNSVVQVPKEPILQEPDASIKYGWITGEHDKARRDIETYRGRILSAMAQGHQGVSFFNLFNPGHPIFNECANLKKMAAQPAKYYHMARGTQQSPAAWLEAGNTYFTYPVVNPAFPRNIGGTSLDINIDIALSEVPFSGKAELLLDFTGTSASAGPVEASFNGIPLEISSDLRDKIIINVPSNLLKQGRNRITISTKNKNPAVLIRDVMLRVEPS